MTLQTWVENASNSKFTIQDDGQCVLLDENKDHYVTITEINDFVTFRFSLRFKLDIVEAYRNALMLNGHEQLIGKASISLGNETDTLILSVFSLVMNQEEFETFWYQAEEIRENVMDCLE